MKPLATSKSLGQVLFDEYGGFADKRYKNPDAGKPFAVDDRSPNDYASDGSFYGWFCSIFAEVAGPQAVKVSLRHAVPRSPGVNAWAARNHAEQPSGLEIVVTPDTVSVLLDLADQIAAIVRPGAPRYAAPGYKYSCPRTAASLRRLLGVLDGYWTTVSSEGGG